LISPLSGEQESRVRRGDHDFHFKSKPKRTRCCTYRIIVRAASYRYRPEVRLRSVTLGRGWLIDRCAAAARCAQRDARRLGFTFF
jgi:hypothetical protein